MRPFLKNPRLDPVTVPLLKACKSGKESLRDKAHAKHVVVYYDTGNAHNYSSSPITNPQCHYSLKETTCHLLCSMNLGMLFLFITQISSV